MYPDPKKLGQQLKYADQRGFAVALIAGSNEFEQNCCQVKDLRSGESKEVSTSDGFDEVVTQIRGILDGA